MMIFFLLLVSAIVLVDLSGSHLSGTLLPLIYLTDGEVKQEINFGEEISATELAEKAQDYIFEGGSENEQKAD